MLINMKLQNSHFKKPLLFSLLSSITLFTFGCHFEPPVNKNSTIIIGSVEIQGSPKENYKQLGDELQKELRKKYGDVIRVKVVTLPTKSFRDVEEKIKNKEWDIAFTVSPSYSILAKKNKYDFVARMFPKEDSGYFETALFVKSDSPIKGEDDIKPGSIIALGDRGSPAFIMPIYDLFGQDVQINHGNTSEDIIKKVESGEADIGVGYTTRLKHLKDIRIIGRSRVLPVGGVYISTENIPKQEDRDYIKDTLLNRIPKEIQEGSNYGQGSEPDYTQVRGIIERSDEIVKCVDWTINPVKLYCDHQISAVKNSRIDGKVNGVDHTSSGNIALKLQVNENQIYRVIVPTDLLKQIPSAPQQENLNRKRIRVSNVDTKPGTSGLQELQITKPEQLKFFND